VLSRFDDMNPLKVKRQKILLLFLLGVGVPSLLLGYLAFRGIQNDRALLEKENREELHDLALMVTGQVDEDIAAVESALLQVLVNRINGAEPGWSHPLQEIKDIHPLIEEIFFIQNGERIVFPVSELLFRENGSLENKVSTPQDYSFQEYLRSAQLAEFQEKNYRKAASLYRQLASRIEDPTIRGTMLNSLARSQKKAGLVSETIETYKQVFDDFALVRSSTGIPLGLAAGFELASLQMAESDSQAAFTTYLHIYKELIGRKWILERSEYDFYSNRTQESLEALLSVEDSKDSSGSYAAEFLRLKEEETALRGKTERLLYFQANAPSELFPLVFRNLPLFVRPCQLESDFGHRRSLLSRMRIRREWKERCCGRFGLVSADQRRLSHRRSDRSASEPVPFFG